jgi:tRNA A58 N-methylase Trm61
MILYLKDPKNSIQKLLDTISSYSMVAFLYTNNEQIEKEYMATIPCTIASKNSNT